MQSPRNEFGKDTKRHILDHMANSMQKHELDRVREKGLELFQRYNMHPLIFQGLRISTKDFLIENPDLEKRQRGLPALDVIAQHVEEFDQALSIARNQQRTRAKLTSALGAILVRVKLVNELYEAFPPQLHAHFPDYISGVERDKYAELTETDRMLIKSYKTKLVKKYEEISKWVTRQMLLGNRA